MKIEKIIEWFAQGFLTLFIFWVVGSVIDFALLGKGLPTLNNISTELSVIGIFALILKITFLGWLIELISKIKI